MRLTRSSRRLLGLALAVGFVVLGLWLVRALPVADWLVATRSWSERLGPMSMLLMVLAIALWGLVLPPSPLQLLAAAVFGVGWAVVIVMAGATLSLIAAVALVRLLGRRWIGSPLADRPRLALIERAVVHHSWRAVVLLRLAHAIPSTIANYLLGCTSLRLWTMVWASWIGKLPGVVVMALLGAAGGDMLTGGAAPGPATWAMAAVGVLGTATLVLVVGRTAKRLWREELAAEASALGESELVDSTEEV